MADVKQRRAGPKVGAPARGGSGRWAAQASGPRPRAAPRHSVGARAGATKVRRTRRAGAGGRRTTAMVAIVTAKASKATVKRCIGQ